MIIEHDGISTQLCEMFLLDIFIFIIIVIFSLIIHFLLSSKIKKTNVI